MTTDAIEEDGTRILAQAFVSQFQNEAQAKAGLRTLFLAAGFKPATASRYARGIYKDLTSECDFTDLVLLYGNRFDWATRQGG